MNNNSYNPFPRMTDAEREEKSILFGQLKYSTNTSLWAAILTFNGLLLTTLSIIISINISLVDYTISALIVAFIISLSFSCFGIYLMFSKQRKIFHNLEKIYDPHRPPKSKNEYKKLVSESLDSVKKFPFWEKITLVLTLINFVIILMVIIILN